MNHLGLAITFLFMYRNLYWLFHLSSIYLAEIIFSLCLFIYEEGTYTQREQQDSRILWWEVLDTVEAAHVWLQWLLSGAEWNPWVQKSIPKCLYPLFGIWQQATGSVHGLCHSETHYYYYYYCRLMFKWWHHFFHCF